MTYNTLDLICMQDVISEKVLSTVTLCRSLRYLAVSEECNESDIQESYCYDTNSYGVNSPVTESERYFYKVN